MVRTNRTTSEATMALDTTASGTSILAELAPVAASAHEMGRRLCAAIALRVRDALDPYRPELHYMRGPGPRWRQKHGVAARSRQGRAYAASSTGRLS
jgi:hypothetical protein